VTGHAAIARGTACPPFVAMEACREHIGEHPCDRRRPIAEQRRDFPGVDFSLVCSHTKSRLFLNIFSFLKLNYI